jgi:lysophospholipase L1-like esterase
MFNCEINLGVNLMIKRTNAVSILAALLSFLFLSSSILNAAVYSNNPAGKKVPITGDTNQMKKFLNALNETKTKKIRIAHFGDSINWGDVITADLRENFQNRFGGRGAGFQSVCSDDIVIKQTTRHTFNDADWEWASLFTRNLKNYPLGIAGTVAKSKGNSWVKYEGTNFKNSSKTFKTIRLFYNNANGKCKATYSLNNGGMQNLKLDPGSNVMESTINASFDATSVKFQFNGCNDMNFFGVSLESGNGVYVDNFPIRGNSGVSIDEISKNLLADFAKKLNYKLIILNYGVNVASAEQTNYTWYRNKMIKVINNLKQAFPDAAILLVSVSDKAIKKGTKFLTDPSVLLVLNEQKLIAQQTGVAFWNCLEAMGGENSMIEWVNQNLAHKDFTHFSDTGGKLLADLLTEAILNVK